MIPTKDFLRIHNFSIITTSVRCLRRQRNSINHRTDENDGNAMVENTSSGPILSRHPQYILHRDSHPMPKPEIEVTKLQDDNKQHVEHKKTLGKHVAESMRQKRKMDAEQNHNCIEKSATTRHNFSRMSQIELAKLLRQNVIYADKNLVLLNKPYGLIAHDGDDVRVSLKSCLPFVSKMIYGINTSIPLSLCNRLDKGTTGITVCAANKDVGQEIVQLFRQQKIRKKYWSILVGCPAQEQGVVDIPMSLHHVAETLTGRSFTKMALNPKKKLDWQSGDLVNVRPRKSEVSITHYRVLENNNGLSLVELQPFTTVKHQLRVHMSEALSCPILGDHKYSKSEALSPQTLPKNILSRFDLKSTKTRTIPMHIHLREILIPDILQNASKPNLLVSGKLPPHMYRTAKLFRLKPGTPTEFMYPSILRTNKPRNIRQDPLLDELYIDPFPSQDTLEKNPGEYQREECYSVHKPRIHVKFKY